MKEIRRIDNKIWLRECLSPARCFASLLFLVVFGAIFNFSYSWVPLVAMASVVFLHLKKSYDEAKRKRFRNKRFESLWEGCKDRYARFCEVLNKLRKEDVANFQEMPNTIRRVSENLYVALRKADIISHEVMETERGIYSRNTNFTVPSFDEQAKMLYQLADKNIAEYRQNFAGVMAGVHRTEAQAAVFMTTLDSLRMKMIGYRLAGKTPELSTDEFIFTLHETKLQLMAIDQALEELDFRSVPTEYQTPPPPPVQLNTEGPNNHIHNTGQGES